MALLSYEHARPWAKAIKEKVVSREMPPWGADPKNSLKMRNDRSLTQEQIDTIVAWVDGGAPRGNDADLPPAPQFAEGWAYGQPDYILEMPVEFDIPADGELPVQMFYTPIPFTEDKFAEVLELRPSNRSVVHHAGVFVVDIPEGGKIVNGRLVTATGKIAGERGAEDFARAEATGLPGASKLLSFVPGRGLDVHRPGIGKRIPAGRYLSWQVHYSPTGKPEKDRTRLGIWFNKVPVTHEVLIRQAGDPIPTLKGATSIYRAEGKEVEYVADESSTRRRGKTPNIPPYAENWSLIGITPVTEPITLYAMSPHMHLRGKSLKWVVTWPDGTDHVPTGRAAEDSGGQQDRRHRRLRQLAEEQVEPGAGSRRVLVGAELGRDVPAVHGIYRGQPGSDEDDQADHPAAPAAVVATSIAQQKAEPLWFGLLCLDAHLSASL